MARDHKEKDKYCDYTRKLVYRIGVSWVMDIQVRGMVYAWISGRGFTEDYLVLFCNAEVVCNRYMIIVLQCFTSL